MARVLDTIRDAIEQAEEPPAHICKGAGVARSQVSRLLSGERQINLETAEKLGAYLGLEIVARPIRGRGPTGTRKGA